MFGLLRFCVKPFQPHVFDKIWEGDKMDSGDFIEKMALKKSPSLGTPFSPPPHPFP